MIAKIGDFEIGDEVIDSEGYGGIVSGFFQYGGKTQVNIDYPKETGFGEGLEYIEDIRKAEEKQDYKIEDKEEQKEVDSLRYVINILESQLQKMLKN